jgi:Signal peptidase, peptidase S26
MTRLQRLCRRLYSTVKRPPKSTYVPQKHTTPLSRVVKSDSSLATTKLSPSTSTSTPPSPARKWRLLNPRRTPLQLLYLWLKIAIFAHIFVKYGYSLIAPGGASMLPTIYFSGEGFLVDKSVRRGRGVRVGDIVSVANPLTVWEGVVKRVVGIEGDFVLAGTPEVSERMIRVCIHTFFVFPYIYTYICAVVGKSWENMLAIGWARRCLC